MRHLVIRNIGPIKEADVELKRFNFFIGAQSSGKSTIAKVLSTCSWVEKEAATMMDEKVIAGAAAFIALMVDFHKMTDYFDDSSEILYETEVVRISLRGKNEFSIQLKDQSAYRREKICYIPSERNSVTLPELQGFEFGQTNLRSFLFDWYNARELYKEDNKVDILNLGVRYYFDPSETKYKDRIEHENGKTYKIPLGSPNALDLIRLGKVKWIVNTREDGESAAHDSVKIRAAAVAAGVPVTTTLAGFAEAVSGLEAIRRESGAAPLSLQEWHANQR